MAYRRRFKIARRKRKDQLTLTRILVTINEKANIDAAFENQILSSLQWIRQKALSEKNQTLSYWDITPWRTFYRNLLNQVLAPRYHAQQEIQKEALCYGSADQVLIKPFSFSSINSMGSIDFLHNKMGSADVEKLYALMNSTQATAYEKFLIGNNQLKKSTVTDFAGTAFLREHNYKKAVEWFSKSSDKGPINKNPFIDLLYDQESACAQDAKIITSKLAFAQEMQRLISSAETDKANSAKNLYKYALGLYNITYYGHTWELVQYYRSGSDGYYVPKNATPFEREYYGAFSAKEYFEKAMLASADKNFKARCLFMMAKCAQKQIRRPQYDDYTTNYDQYDAADKKYMQEFKNSPLFPQFVKEYSSTAFYKEALTSCSYLRDFVKRR